MATRKKSINDSGMKSRSNSSPNDEDELKNGKFIFKDGTLYEGGYKRIEETSPAQTTPEIDNDKMADKTGSDEKKFIVVRHGSGKNICGKTGTIYEGEYSSDKMDGKGKLTFKNGVIYDGHFQDNKFQGNGEYYFADGSKFVGAWDAGIPHGNGNYFDKQGHKWVGQFFNGSSKGLICEVM